MNPNCKVYVAGHGGLVGSAILRKLVAAGYTNTVVRTHAELDLEDQQAVFAFFNDERPEYVFLAAARVGGILANTTYPADFIRSNLAIQCNVLEAAHRYGVKKLLFLGSSCIYPKHAPQPIREEYLMSGYLEPTNQAYAIAKIAGIEMCRAYNRQFRTNFISAMPTNLYGPGDNFDLETSHVMPALIRKFHEATVNRDGEVVVWGTGNVRREFLYIDDMADACLFLMQRHDGSEIVNVGSGVDVSISELASLIGECVGYRGRIVYDAAKPDGTPRKLLDVTRLQSLGWHATVSLENGIARTCQWYVREQRGRNIAPTGVSSPAASAGR